jgi:transcriptional repressor NrdR
MKCPKCGSEKSKVINSRKHEEYAREESIYRRRECLKCGFRFSTYELRADQITFED